MYPPLRLQDRESLGTAVKMWPALNIPGSVSSRCGGERRRKKKNQAAADCHGEEDVHAEFHRLMSPRLTASGDNT